MASGGIAIASPGFPLQIVGCRRFPSRRVHAITSSSGARSGRMRPGVLFCQTRKTHLQGLIVCQAQNVKKKADERSGAAQVGLENGSAKSPPVWQVLNVGSQTGSPSGGGPTAYPFWARAVDVVAKFLGVDVGTGLSAQSVEVRRAKFGWNELDKPSKRPFWQLVAEQFEDTLVQILLGAAGISLILAISDANGSGEIGVGEFTESIIILSIVVLNAVVGVWQESRAEGTLEALKCMQSETSRVLRDGTQILDLPTRELVPGDIVELRAGDKVPADMRVIRLKSGTLRIQQSALTGESQPVLKQTEEGTDEDIELQGKDCMVFAGTVVTNGTCQCIVTATGMRTEIGKIQSQIQEASLSNYESPLSDKLDDFADLLTKVVGGVCIVVWLVNYKYFVSWEEENGLQFRLAEATYYFKVAVALAVAAIPEGLPAVITTCLALGTRRMAQENAIVRKLPSVETLGCTTVICSDKTGTLTTNQMAVKEITAVEAEGQLQSFTVGGTSYDPRDGEVQQLPAVVDMNLQSLAQICALCNDAVVQFKDKKFNAIGMPTEAALLVLAEKLGLPGLHEQESSGEAQTIEPDTFFRACAYWGTVYSRLFTLEFDRSRKSMSVIVTGNNSPGAVSENKLLVKGAAECVLERCTAVQLKDGSVVPLLPVLRQSIMERVNCMARRGLRVLALAFKTELGILSDYTGAEHVAHELLLRPESYMQLESGLTFVGLTGLQDPPRPEVRNAIKDCTKAGIRVIVITGDNQTTAEAICQEIGLFKEDEDVTRQSFLGREFMRMSQSERQDLLQSNQLPGCRDKNLVFSRAEPIHKQEIVRMLKAGNGVVAMTGDGVNDAPALKLADIGIAMGLSGTEVAKEASDMVLADDNFATIVKAVGEGRSIYDNMKAFIRYLISSNIGEVISILLTALLGFPQGLLPVQLLWVNLVTDGAPATALGFNPPDKDIMDRPPRLPSDGLVSGWTLVRFMAVGTYVGLATVGIFALWYTNNTTFLGIDLSKDGHSAVTIHQLMNWVECPLSPDFHANSFTAGSTIYSFSDPCEYFTTGKVKASTLAMTTLVVIEMFNALNALSETNSLLTVPPWSNRWLVLAIAVSLGLHVAILYTPWLADAFGVVPLSLDEWLLVVAVSFPVIPLDESLKLLGRYFDRNQSRNL